VLAFGFIGMQQALGLWSRETRVGRAAADIRKGEETTATAELLTRTATEYPYYSSAHYFLGTLVVRGEQKRVQDQRSVQGVNLALLDKAKNHLLQSLETSLFPYSPLLALGQGLLLGARVAREARDQQNAPLVAQFAQEAMIQLLRALKLNPDPAGNSADLWVEVADAAAMSGHPGVTLYALGQSQASRSQSLTPRQAQRVPVLTQEAGFALADSPLLAVVLFRQWSADPGNEDTWKRMASLSAMPGGHMAALVLLHRVAQRSSGNPLPTALIRSVLGRQPTP